MAPFTAWLPAQRDQTFDLVVTIVGDGIPGLKSGLAAFEEALASEGYQVLAQQGRMNGQALLSTVRLRVSTDPVNSMGNGCDVLAYLGDDVPPLNVFGLGQGSAVLCEAEGLPRGTQTTAPTGVIAYHVPFENLSRRIGKSFSGKGLIGIGVLTQFLMIPPDRVRTRIRTGVPRRYFDAGVKYATDHVRKRDVFALPVRETIGSASLLNPHQAVWLGLGLSQCTCESACVGELDRSATAWVTRHLTEGRQLASVLKSRRLPGLTAYRSLDGRVIAIVGGTDSSLLEEFGDHRSVTLIPGNLQDLVCLMGEACRLGRNRDLRVFVLVDEELAQREQSISRQALKTIAGASRGYGGKEHGQDCGLGSEWDLDLDAEVGYVAWGAAQGAVRDAISLCRRFGLKVAALYPKMLEPLPVKDLRVFAASSKQVVVVEPDQQGRYTDLVKSATGHKPATIRPAEGNRITPMDLFMREDLGAALSNRPKGALHEFL